jgi:uncharacterized membrane protein
MTLEQLILAALLVEAIVEYVKLIFVNRQINWKQVTAIVLGIAVAVLASFDLFAIMKINFVVPYVGSILTGILLSRGSNFLADLFKRLRGEPAITTNSEGNE